MTNAWWWLNVYTFQSKENSSITWTTFTLASNRSSLNTSFITTESKPANYRISIKQPVRRRLPGRSDIGCSFNQFYRVPGDSDQLAAQFYLLSSQLLSSKPFIMNECSVYLESCRFYHTPAFEERSIVWKSNGIGYCFNAMSANSDRWTIDTPWTQSADTSELADAMGNLTNSAVSSSMRRSTSTSKNMTLPIPGRHSTINKTHWSNHAPTEWRNQYHHWWISRWRCNSCIRTLCLSGRVNRPLHRWHIIQ